MPKLQPYYYQANEDAEPEFIGYCSSWDEAVEKLGSERIYEMSVVDVCEDWMLKEFGLNKYIRTKDTIFEVVEETNIVYTVKAKGKHHHLYNKSKCQTDVVALGDTIEELCDEFVEVGNGKPYFPDCRFKHWDKQTKNILIKQGIDVYGAIWTKKGLIYVAKMNEKGELELL